MPTRAVWTGTVHVALLTVPCRAHPSTTTHDHKFSTYNTATGEPLGRLVVDKSTGAEVPAEQQGRRIKWGGDWIPVTDDQLAVAYPAPLTKQVTLDGFVPLADVDPRGIGKSYDLTPDAKQGGSANAYALLAAALEQTGRCAVGAWTYKGRARLALIYADAGALTLAEYAWPDELQPHAADEELTGRPDVNPDHLAAAVALIETMACDWVHAEHTDPRHEAITGMLDQLAAGRTPAATEVPATASAVDDLMAALTASVDAARAA